MITTSYTPYVANYEDFPKFSSISSDYTVPPPPKGPDSFVLTYKFYETLPCGELAPPTGNPGYTSAMCAFQLVYVCTNVYELKYIRS